MGGCKMSEMTNPNNSPNREVIQHLALDGRVEELQRIIKGVGSIEDEALLSDLEVTSKRLEVTMLFRQALDESEILFESRPEVIKLSETQNQIDISEVLEQGLAFERNIFEFIEELRLKKDYIFLKDDQQDYSQAQLRTKELQEVLSDPDRQIIAVKALRQLGGKDLEWIQQLTEDVINGIAQTFWAGAVETGRDFAYDAKQEQSSTETLQKSAKEWSIEITDCFGTVDQMLESTLGAIDPELT
jgi:hypothetical protein